MSGHVRAGIIGTGFIAQVHAAAVRAAGGRVMLVAGGAPGHGAGSAGRLRAEHPLTSAEELIASPEVDVVHICTPNALHAPLAERALLAGKPVICEKPLATTVEDARMLTALAADRDLLATVPFIYRFYPAVRAAQDRVRRGRPGPLHVLHGSYLQDWLSRPEDDNWRVDPALGGASRAFGDIGVHWCDLVEFVSGHRITRVAATARTVFGLRGPAGERQPVGTEDAVTVAFATDGGAAGSAVLSQVSAGRKNRLWFSLDGEAESLAFDQESPDALWIGGRRENRVLLRGSESFGAAGAAYSVLPAGHPQGYQECFNAFVRDSYAALAGRRPGGLPTFADGLRAAVLTEAVLKAADKETWVEVTS
jgi:predicted dehydrogenase